MGDESERAVLLKYIEAKKSLDAVDDELFKHFEPLVVAAAKESPKAASGVLMHVPESFARFRLWRVLATLGRVKCPTCRCHIALGTACACCAGRSPDEEPFV